MHSTHQFFLTQWTLYLLVLDGRRGREEEDAEYWLGLIDSFAPDSPVIIVLNKIKEHRFTVDRRVLQKKFPNIHNFVETDCEDRTGIDRLFQAIQRELDRLEHLRDPFPNSWFAIKNRLAGMADNYLTFYRYREICREEGETDVQAQDSLALYLHSMGIVLNYKDDLRLRDTYVLNPRWVTEGIYSILSCDRVAQCKGELSLEDLKEILDVEGYLPEHYRFILEMMRKFELAFQFGDEDGRYLIPELLNKEQPTEADAFTLEQCLNFKYQYPILPEGLLPRFIVRSYVLSVDRPRWRTGVILDLEGSRALVRANKLDKCVQISVTGRMMGRRQLLTVIRSDFEHIHRSYKFKPQEIVPVPNHPEVLVPYNDLRVMEQEGLVEFPMVAGEKLISVKVKDMLDGVDLEGMRPATSKEDVSVRKLQLFYSYSHKDEKLRDELATHLKIFKRQGLIQQWHDREITAGTEWKGQIDDNLEHADIILLLVSADFIASDYCYDIEMNRALQRHEEGSAHVIPIIISDVNWHNTPFGKLQALPEDDRTVVRRGSGRYARAQAWKKVADGIEKVLKTWK